MKETTGNIFDELFTRYPELENVKESIRNSFEIIKKTYLDGGKLLCGGNGGSASDCEHIVGELLKSFKKKRGINPSLKDTLTSLGDEGKYIADRLEGALPAISLISHTGLITAFANDVSWDTALAQQVNGLGKRGDCLVVLSTSGNSKNCVYASIVARALGMKVIALTGEGGGRLKSLSDVCITVPAKETFKVQEYHLPVYHTLCAMLEEELF